MNYKNIIFLIIFSLSTVVFAQESDEESESSGFISDLDVGLLFGFTPGSLENNLTTKINGNLDSWGNDTTAGSNQGSISTKGSAKNLMAGLTVSTMLNDMFYLRLDPVYAFGIGGFRSATATNFQFAGNTVGIDKIEARDSFSFISVPLYVGLKKDFFHLGFGPSFNSVTYQEQWSESSNGQGNLSTSFDRKYTGSGFGFNIISGIDLPLVSDIRLSFDLMYTYTNLQLKYSGKKFMNSSQNSTLYKSITLNGFSFMVATTYRIL